MWGRGAQWFTIEKPMNKCSRQPSSSYLKGIFLSSPLAIDLFAAERLLLKRRTVRASYSRDGLKDSISEGVGDRGMS